jgi:hypothetical protein
MPLGKPKVRTPRWYWILLRVVLATILLTLIVFAISLLLGIVITVVAALFTGSHPNMTVAYRYFALPMAALAALTGLVVSTVLESRRYRQSKILAELERAA